MKRYITAIIIGFASVFTLVLAQQNVDSIFNKALLLVKSQQIPEAIKESEKALSIDPKRGDICVFLANLNSWQNNNEVGLQYIQKAANLNYKKDDYYEAWSNILIRSKKYQDLIDNSTDFEQNYTNKDDFFQKKITALDGLKEYNTAVDLIKNDPQKRYLTLPNIGNMYSDILFKRNTNTISAYYTLDILDNGFTPQHLGSLGYSFPVGIHSLGFRANYANRYGLNDVQLEADFYLKLNKGQYTYFNYGYAFNANLFPQHRIGIEHYFPLFPKTDASLGIRYLDYISTKVFILTGHIERYLGNNWLSLRPYYVYKTPAKTNALTLIGNYRLFGKNELNYWGVEVGYGSSPDDIFSTTLLNSYKIKLEKNIMLDRVSDLHMAVGYTKEEWRANTFRNRLTVELGYKIRIK